MGFKIENRPLYFNPWFKNLFTGECFLLDSITRHEKACDLLGTTLIGWDSRGKKRQFDITFPNYSKLKIELHMDEAGALIL